MDPQVIDWVDPVTGKTCHGIQVSNFGVSIDCERHESDICSICLKPWTHDHQMCCLPCGHIFGIACFKDWMDDFSDKCPQCNISFSPKSLWRLYDFSSVPKLCIRRFSFSKKGFAAFKRYEQILWTNALKLQADVLVQQKDAMKRRTELLNQMNDSLRDSADALGQLTDEYYAFGQQVKALNQEVKSLRQLVDSYLESRMFYIQSYNEFLALHDNKITE